MGICNHGQLPYWSIAPLSQQPTFSAFPSEPGEREAKNRQKFFWVNLHRQNSSTPLHRQNSSQATHNSTIDNSSGSDFALITAASRKKHRFKSEVCMQGPALEIQEDMTEHEALTAICHGKMPINRISRHYSHGFGGGNTVFNNDQVGLFDSFIEEVVKGRLPSLPSKELDNFLLKRAPLSRNSSLQEALSELASNPVIQGKHLPSSVPLEGFSVYHSSFVKEI